ncbi:hypothetical protein LZ30DRAFT_737443 [Colletotrichum cereale]|nr:hypothetical protein LZ30DRAFT_737443 [Colletotrichum cereale]
MRTAFPLPYTTLILPTRLPSPPSREIPDLATCPAGLRRGAPSNYARLRTVTDVRHASWRFLTS